MVFYKFRSYFGAHEWRIGNVIYRYDATKGFEIDHAMAASMIEDEATEEQMQMLTMAIFMARHIEDMR